MSKVFADSDEAASPGAGGLFTGSTHSAAVSEGKASAMRPVRAADATHRSASATTPASVSGKQSVAATLHRWMSSSSTSEAAGSRLPPNTKLLNPANQCYINSVAIMLNWALRYTGLAPDSLRDIGPAVRLELTHPTA